MTDEEAEAIVREVLKLRSEGVKEDKELCTELKDLFDLTEDDAGQALKMISTGFFRASVISKTGSYPQSNIHISSDPVLKSSFQIGLDRTQEGRRL